MTRPAWIAACFALACGDGELHPCDEGTPTCQSSLVIRLPEGNVSTAFRLEVRDDVGLDIAVECPEPEGGFEPIDGYTLTCGAGQLTIATNRHFGDNVTVQYEASQEEVYTPRYQKGGDFCGNPCTIGTIDIVL